MWEFFAAVAPLFIMIYKEYLSNAAKADAEKQAFNLDQDMLKKIVDAAVTEWNASNQEKSRAAKNAWDAADEDQNEPPSSK